MCSHDNGELFRKKISICEVRPLIKNTSLGTSFYDLRRGLERLGINSTISQACKDKDVFDEISYPFITQIENSEGIHYVTIFEKKRSKLVVGDSSRNKQQSISISKFMNRWIPFVLELDLANSGLVFEIEQKTKEINIASILKLVKWNLVISFVLSIVIYAVGIILANMFSLYFNILIPQSLGGLVLQFMATYLLINIFHVILSFANNYTYNIMSKKIDENIIKKYFSGLLDKPNMAIESYEVGELITNLSNIIMIRQRFLTYLQMIPISLLTMIFSLYLLFSAEQNLASFVFILIIVLGVVLYLSQEHYERLSKLLYKTSQEFNESVINIFKNTSVIKQLGLEKEFSNRGVNRLSDFISTRTKMANFEAIQNQLKTFILSSFSIVLFSSGVYLIINNQLSTGVLLTFNALLSYVTNPIINLADLQSVLIQGKVAQDRLYNTLESKIKLYGNENLNGLDDEINITLEDVSFDYDSNAKIFNNLSVSITGDNIAVSGLNGVGKSTFGKLIARLYIPDNGSVILNGQNLLDLSEESIVKNIIYVDGRENLFKSSVLDNIKLGRDIEDEDIFNTLDQLNARPAFPNLDFENIDNEQLSLGQMQIVKVLRSTLIKKKIYIFDEITNGLDIGIKSSVIDYLLNLEGMKIFVTHDKEVIDRCEKDFVVKDKSIMRRQ